MNSANNAPITYASRRPHPLRVRAVERLGELDSTSIMRISSFRTRKNGELVRRDGDSSEDFPLFSAGNSVEPSWLNDEARPICGVEDRNTDDVSDDDEAETVLTLVSGFH